MLESPFKPPFVLVFSASDPSCGAGMQADILTLASLGCHPVSALTAITVQDTHGVESIHPVTADILSHQARTLLRDIPVSAFKIGVLGSLENIQVTAEILADHPDTPVILDPVLASGRGDALSDQAMLEGLKKWLLPHCSLITPNSIEAQKLAGFASDTQEGHDPDTLAQTLIHEGSEFVLLTGTHLAEQQVINRLYGPQGLIREDGWERLPDSYHGSGCTLASAITAGMAHGKNLEEAVYAGQAYTWQTLARAFRPGTGQFIPDRLFQIHPQHNRTKGQ